MTLRTRLLITALVLCHQVPSRALVTRQLLGALQEPTGSASQQSTQTKPELPASSPCSTEAAEQDADATTICALQQEKIGNVYKLHGNAEIHHRGYVLRADELTYDSDRGEATASGHFTIDGGPNDDHIKASHGTYNVTAETGTFYDVSATTGLKFKGTRVILTSTAPFAFSGKVVEKTSPEHYVVYDGTITTCELPHPKWMFQARRVVVDAGGNASIYHSTFLLDGFPIFYFPYATHPVAKEARHSGFLVPTGGRSSTKGNVIGDSFYWAINRSMRRAEKLGLLATDDEVDRKFNEIKSPFSQEEFDKRLQDRKITVADFKRDIRRSITVDKVMNKEVSSKINVTDQDIGEYYNAHKAEFNLIEPQYHLAQIMVWICRHECARGLRPFLRTTPYSCPVDRRSDSSAS